VIVRSALLGEEKEVKENQVRRRVCGFNVRLQEALCCGLNGWSAHQSRSFIVVTSWGPPGRVFPSSVSWLRVQRRALLRFFECHSGGQVCLAI